MAPYFSLLGPLEVIEDGRPMAIGGGKRRALLALLLLHPNEAVSAERLIDELWGEQPPATATKGLQVCVSQLRKELGGHVASGSGELLVTRSHGYLLRIGAEDLDIRRFERALSDGERALSAGHPAQASERLREGLGLWRGPPLADFTYERFAQHEIARLEDLRLVALEERIDADLALGRHAHVVGELEGLADEHPLREGVRAQLMVALYRCGRQAEALEAYRNARLVLIEQLGLEPGPALRELEAKVLAHSPDLAPPTEPELDAEDGSATERVPDAGDSVRAGADADAPLAAPKQPAGRSRPPPLPLRAAVMVLAAAVMLAGATIAALARDTEKASFPRGPELDLAANSIAAVAAAGRRAQFGLPLPGRPTDIAAAGGTVFAVTVDSAALTEVEARSRSIIRTIPLDMTPAAVAAGGGSVWIADARRGLLVRVEPGYERPSARITYRRSGRVPGAGRGRRRSTALAIGAGAVWVADGSARLTRVDAATEAVTSHRAPDALDGVAVGAGAVWAFSARSASVVRLDPRLGVVTDVIPIVARPGSEAPSPVGIAATPDAVWILNGNTATVTRIDPENRGVVTTIPIGVDRAPRDIAAAGRTVWVSNFDGSLSRIVPESRTPTSLWVGESLTDVAADGGTVWVTTTALDRQLPGGSG